MRYRRLASLCLVLTLLAAGCGGAPPTTGPAPQVARPAGDVVDVGPDPIVERLPVEGKVTVVEFWASWAGESARVSAYLADVAAQREDVAVRRIDLSRDLELGKRLIGPRPALPTVWIHDRAGRRVWSLTGVDRDGVAAALGHVLGTR